MHMDIIPKTPILVIGCREKKTFVIIHDEMLVLVAITFWTKEK